jgi:hypothetical protein
VTTAPASSERMASRKGRSVEAGSAKGEAAQRLERGDEQVPRGDERVLGRRGIVSARVAEAAAHDSEHGAGLG